MKIQYTYRREFKYFARLAIFNIFLPWSYPSLNLQTFQSLFCGKTYFLSFSYKSNPLSYPFQYIQIIVFCTQCTPEPTVTFGNYVSVTFPQPKVLPNDNTFFEKKLLPFTVLSHFCHISHVLIKFVILQRKCTSELFARPLVLIIWSVWLAQCVDFDSNPILSVFYISFFLKKELYP